MVFSAFPLLLLFLTGISFWVVEAEVHYYDFVLAEKNFTRLCKAKSMLVVNDQFPGPTIYVHKGDTVFVNVYNHGDYGLTIHWHGVKQPRNPWSDGTAYITQCPFEPGKNFTYEVVFSDEEGTLETLFMGPLSFTLLKDLPTLIPLLMEKKFSYSELGSPMM